MEVVRPAFQVLLRADTKGAEIGSAVGLALAVPYSMSKGDRLSVGGAACMAGTGMVAGSCLMVIRAGVSMIQSGDKEEIKQRAADLKFQPIDKACTAAAVGGIAIGLRRMKCMQTNDEPLSSMLLSKRGVWALLAYSALGVGVAYGAYVLVNGGKKTVAKIKAKIEEKKEECEKKEVANGTVTAVEEVKKEVEEVTEEVKESVKEAVETAVNAATEAVEEATASTTADSTK